MKLSVLNIFGFCDFRGESRVQIGLALIGDLDHKNGEVGRISIHFLHEPGEPMVHVLTSSKTKTHTAHDFVYDDSDTKRDTNVDVDTRIVEDASVVPAHAIFDEGEPVLL